MRTRLISLFIFLFLVWPGAAPGQSLSADGTVTEVSSDRIVVEYDTSTAVSAGDQGRIFVTKRIGTGGQQDIIAGILRVETVSGPLLIGRVTERSDLLDVQQGQNVAFQTGSGSAGVGGLLVVRSTPSGASLRITRSDASSSAERSLGETPVRDSVSSGRYRIEVMKSGYRPANRSVRIRPGADRTLEVSLERRTGQIVVQPEPDTATVVVDGQRHVGSVRDTLTAGRYAVRVAAQGYATHTDTVDVAPGEARTLTPALERKMGTLTVRSSPDGATVRLDGMERGETPVRAELPVGTHAMSVTKDGYNALEDTVTVRSGEGREVDVDLKRPLNVQLVSSKGPVSGATLTRVGDRLRVKYDLTGKEKAYDVVLQMSGDGGKTFTQIDRATLRGDVGEDISPGQKKEIHWNALERFPRGLFGHEYQIRVWAQPPVTGEFTLEVQTPPGEFGFGGGRIGWSGENGFLGASYSKIGYGVTVISFRAMPHWTFGGWFTYRTIVGLAYIDGVPSSLSGGMEFGTGIQIGKSVYVGSDVLYLQTLAGEGEVGAMLTLGVAL